MTPLKNIVIVGASYVGCNVTKRLLPVLPNTHRIVLIDKNSHFNHLFVFPRFAVCNTQAEHKAFIPRTQLLKSHPDSVLLHALVTKVTDTQVLLDRSTEMGDSIPYDILVLATGSVLPQPGTLPTSEKKASTQWLIDHQKKIQDAKEIVIVGGGAVGVQISGDIKELYPTKKVTLVHSRTTLMNTFNSALHDKISKILSDLGVELVLGERVTNLDELYAGTSKEVKTNGGKVLKADEVLLCTGQKYNSSILSSLSPSSIEPSSNMINVLSTLQIADAKYPNVFAVGDVSNTGPVNRRDYKGHVDIVAQNIMALINKTNTENKYIDLENRKMEDRK